MTRTSPRSIRPWKSQKWLVVILVAGRLLGCLTLKEGTCGSSGSDIDLPAQSFQTDINRNTPVRVGKNRYLPLSESSHLSSSNNVVLKDVQGINEDEVLLLGSTKDQDPSGSGSMFGELELALYEEGLLEFCDPQASIPVLNIGYGFTNEELKALSKRVQAYSKCAEWADQYQYGEAKGYEKMLGAQCSLEPFIDGLPASVWLECVEPTLSILISLNSLRHRRSNLSVKKGLPETLDSNRSRHGDFELGPIAIFHHPGRIQQMMLLRVEFLNAAATAAAAVAGNNPDNNVNQSAEHNGRRGYNRHRRFRHALTEEMDVENFRNLHSTSNELVNAINANDNNNHHRDGASNNCMLRVHDNRDVRYLGNSSIVCGHVVRNTFLDFARVERAGVLEDIPCAQLFAWTRIVGTNDNNQPECKPVCFRGTVLQKPDGQESETGGDTRAPTLGLPPLLVLDYSVDTMDFGSDDLSGGAEKQHSYSRLPYFEELETDYEYPHLSERFGDLCYNQDKIWSVSVSSRPLDPNYQSLERQCQNRNCNGKYASPLAESHVNDCPCVHRLGRCCQALAKEYTDLNSNTRLIRCTKPFTSDSSGDGHLSATKRQSTSLNRQVSDSQQSLFRALSTSAFDYTDFNQFLRYDQATSPQDYPDWNCNAGSAEIVATSADAGRAGDWNTANEMRDHVSANNAPPNLATEESGTGVLGRLVTSSASIMLGTVSLNPEQASALLNQAAGSACSAAGENKAPMEGEQDVHIDGGDNVLKRGAHSINVIGMLRAPSPAEDPHAPPTVPNTAAIITTNHNTTAHTTTTTTTTRPVDMQALGDSTMCQHLPDNQYQRRHSQSRLGNAVHSQPDISSLSRGPSGRQSLTKYSRDFIGRARTALSCWNI